MSSSELHKKFSVSAEQLDTWAAEYENASWEGMDFGQIVRGRPRISSEELKPITIKVPASRVAAIQHVADKNGISRSEFLRRAIDNEIIALS